jgi:hypothetical protein
MLSTGAERRVFERHVPKDLVFATFRPTFDRMGRIKDISKGGLSMEYTLLDEKPGLEDMVVIDMFNNEKKYNFFSVPCHVIYDKRVNEGEGFLSSIETRRCGLKFQGLKPEQTAHLEMVLKEMALEREGVAADQDEVHQVH